MAGNDTDSDNSYILLSKKPHLKLFSLEHQVIWPASQDGFQLILPEITCMENSLGLN